MLWIEGAVQGWIPMVERYPDKDGDYLTCDKDGRVAVLPFAMGWNCMRKDDGTVYREHEFIDIVAWMPLPEPYVEDE